MNVNVNLMEKNVIQFNSGITIKVDVSAKKSMYVKKIMFGTLVNVFVKIKKIEQVLSIIQRLSVMKLWSHMEKK